MNIAFIGGGNMAGALIGGLARADPSRHALAVLEVDADRRRQLPQEHSGLRVYAEPGDWLAGSELVVLAVKPQQTQAAATAIRPHLREPLVVSIAAGVRACTLARWLDTERIVRAMPNTPALIGAGISGLAALPGVSAADRAAAGELLGAVGTVLWFDDESMLDPVTAISGSGPAYVFYFIEALQQAALEMGLSAPQAAAMSVQTFRGAALLAADSDDPVSVLRQRVTSKGGTTAAALAHLDSAGVKASIVAALHAANARARELGDEFDR